MLLFCQILMRTLLLIALAFPWALPTAAEIYKQVDENGRVTYSNLPSKGSKKLDLPEVSTIPAPKAPVAAPANFPKVDGKTQKDRDDMRRNILADELQAEEKALAEAQAALKEGEAVRLGNERNYQKYLDRVQGLKDTLDLHEKNVAALRKELTGLR